MIRNNFLNAYSSLKINSLSDRLAGVDRLRASLFAAWILSFIALPPAKYFWGESAVIWGVTLGVACQATLVLHLLAGAWGARRTLQAALIITLTGLGIEAIGAATGLPFGVYHYTDKLQPQIANVPLLIPVAWLMMLPSAWAAAYLITGLRSRPAFVGVSALALTAWDLFLDPQMVAWDFWRWQPPGGYFGIPWLNFLGWTLTAAVMTLWVRPTALPVRPLLLIYIITWLLETIGLLFFWNLPGPALVGFIGMGGFIGWAWWSGLRDWRLKD